MRLAALLPALLLVLAPLSAAADGFIVNGEVRDADFPQDPRFDRVLVTVSVMQPSVGPDGLAVRQKRNFDPDESDGAFRFRDNVGDSRDFTNMIAIVDVLAGDGDYILPDPDEARILLAREIAGRDIDVALNLRHRSSIAEGYRRSVLDTLRKPQLTEPLIEGASKAAAAAVNLDPKLDNYLLTIRVTSAALRRGIHGYDAAVASVDDLEGLFGFADLDLDQRWRVQTALLDALAQDEDMHDEALRLGRAMLDSLPLNDDAALERLRIVHAFMTVSDLYADNGDCRSLADNAAQAVGLAARIHMDWTSQRSLMLEWGDCLERLSGAGNGRSGEQYRADAAANEALAAQWAVFATAGDAAYDGIALSTVDRDVRLRGLIETARAIRGE